jgi:hypothetical protein
MPRPRKFTPERWGFSRKTSKCMSLAKTPRHEPSSSRMVRDLRPSGSAIWALGCLRWSSPPRSCRDRTPQRHRSRTGF